MRKSGERIKEERRETLKSRKRKPKRGRKD